MMLCDAMSISFTNHLNCLDALISFDPLVESVEHFAIILLIDYEIMLNL